MAKDVQQVISVRPQYQVKRGAIKMETGLCVQYKARAIFDFSLLDSAGVANSAIGTHGLGVFLPAKAVVTKVWFQTVTGFTSATNIAQIALTANAAGDLKAATVISNAAYVGAGINAGVPDDTVTNFKTCSVEREISVAVTVEALTAGRMLLFCEYYVGE